MVSASELEMKKVLGVFEDSSKELSVNVCVSIWLLEVARMIM